MVQVNSNFWKLQQFAQVVGLVHSAVKECLVFKDAAFKTGDGEKMYSWILSWASNMKW